MPFVVAVLIAYLFSALVDWIRKAGPWLPGWLSYIIALIVFCICLSILVQLVASNLSKVAAAAPTYEANLENILLKVADRLELEEIPTVEQLRRNITESISARKLVGGIVASASAFASKAFIIALYTLFLLMERGSIGRKLLLLVPSEEGKQKLDETLTRIGARIRRYVSLKTLVSLIAAVASWIVMLIIGIDFAGFWAVLIFILNFIPYIGSIVAVAFPVTLTLVQFGSFSLFIVALVALTGIQIAVGNLIEPRLMGHSLNLSPVVILLSLAIWASLWGVVGAILCVPITVMMLIVFSQFEYTRPIAILLSKDGSI